MWSAGRGCAAGAALLGLLLALSVPGSGAAKTGAGVVTCGSVLKLFNTQHRVRLHSHDVKYGSGARGLGLGIAWGRGGGWEFEGRVMVGDLRPRAWGCPGWSYRGTEEDKDRRLEGVVARLGAKRVVWEFIRGPGVGAAGGAVRVSGWRRSWKVYGVRAEGRGFWD